MKAALAALVLLLATLVAHAEATQEHPLEDAASVIPAVDEPALETELRALRAAGADLAVIIINTTGGQSIEAYARKRAANWATGNTPAAVFVLAIKDRKSRLEVSEPLRARFPDARAQSILDNIKGYLRAKDYTGAVRAVITEVKNGFAGVAPDTESPHPQVEDPTAVEAPVVEAPREPHVAPAYDPPPPNRKPVAVIALGGVILLLGAFLWARSRISKRATLTADGVIQSDRPLWMETLWCVLLIFGGIIYVIGVILASTSSNRRGYSTSSSSWDSSSGGSSFGSDTSSFGGGSSSSSSSGGGWSGGGASSSW